ncbi:hypothetical protein [uncultured Nostoc sp.]|uniref:hypothetical protein n=1 Tax=uncultured Nostoc sp. TaxID=340711 RepID=UPI0035CBF11D
MEASNVRNDIKNLNELPKKALINAPVIIDKVMLAFVPKVLKIYHLIPVVTLTTIKRK